MHELYADIPCSYVARFVVSLTPKQCHTTAWVRLRCQLEVNFSLFAVARASLASKLADEALARRFCKSSAHFWSIGPKVKNHPSMPPHMLTAGTHGCAKRHKERLPYPGIKTRIESLFARDSLAQPSPTVNLCYLSCYISSYHIN